MKKTALVLGLSALIFFGKHDSSPIMRNYQQVNLPEMDNNSINSQSEYSLVQLRKAGMCHVYFGTLQKAIGHIDVSNYAVDSDTKIVLVESLNHNVNVKGFNKMIDNFNSLYATDNVALMQSYQSYADENCKKIYGCVGTISDAEYDWKIIKFLPNPEKCQYEPTITMSNVMVY
ncbi:MAG: hypothetical protein V4585_22465 [Bacteroidota bacterium]